MGWKAAYKQPRWLRRYVYALVVAVTAFGLAVIGSAPDIAIDAVRKTASQYQCDKIWAVSPEGNLGCVHEYTAIRMENYGWKALDGYSEIYMQELRFPNSAGPRGYGERDDYSGHLEIELSMPNLPLVGQNATVILDINSPDGAPAVNATFQFLFIGDVEIVSSDPPMQLDEYGTRTRAGQFFDTSYVLVEPGESRQITVTVTPVREDNVYIHAAGFDEHGLSTSSSDTLHLSFGYQTSGYQMNKDSYTPDPNTEYMWTERIHPQCWSTPWFGNGQTVQDYYHHLGIEVLDTKRLGPPAGIVCDACQCLGGTILFLTPASDYDAIPAFGIFDGYEFR